MILARPVFLAAIAAAFSFGLAVVVVSTPMRIGGAQTPPIDPGPRTSVNLFAFSQPFSTLSAVEFRNFGCPDGTIASCATNTTSGAQGIFNLQWSVTGTVVGEPEPGLGPRYNANGCFWCHANPIAGGSSPSTNAEVAMASLNARTGFNANVVPSTNYYAPDGTDGQPFIRADGPTRGVFQRSTGDRLRLYTIGGTDGPMMTDTVSSLPGCTSSVLPQPDFASLLGTGDISPLIPPPLFGLGLIEAIPDSNLRAQQDPTKFATYGIPLNTFNLTDVGTISKIGWKADVSSVNAFAADALAIEIGASSQTYPQKTDATPACKAGGLPDDHVQLTSRSTCSGCAMDFASAAEGTTYFVTHLEAPLPVWDTNPPGSGYTAPVPSGWNGSSTTAYTTAAATVTRGSVYNGFQQFQTVGCDTCHAVSHTTAPSKTTGIGGKTIYNFGDLALHHMGIGMDNGISAGRATGDQFRTANLWGAGQRLWFNHDGRTNNLYAAIQAHCTIGSVATAVCHAFNLLSLSNQQDLLNFLRGL